MKSPDAPLIEESEQLQAALAYAARGWHVLPVWWPAPGGGCGCGRADCDEKKWGKHPIPHEGLKAATTDPTRIRAWWSEYPDANVAIRTGAISGITVIDIDIADGKQGPATFAALIERHGEPATVKAISGSGGAHYFFKYNSALKNDVNVLGPGVDVRNDGGYIIVAPSRHKSGGVYGWERDTPLADLPAHLTRPVPTKAKTNAKASQKRLPSLDELRALLEHVDPDDRDMWLGVGLILGREYDRSDEAFAVYEEWASKSPKHRDRGTPKAMKAIFYEESAESPSAGKEPLTIGTLIKWATEGGWQRRVESADPRDGNHHALAGALLDTLAAESGGERPVNAEGAVWLYSDGLWTSRDPDEFSIEVGRRYGGGKLCRKAGDFAQVGRYAAQLCTDKSFFEPAPIGIATPAGFWRVTDAGEIVCEPLTARHKQRFRVQTDPMLDGPGPQRLLGMLEQAFAGQDPVDQIQLLQQLAGAALTRSLWRHRLAALLLGPTSSGKSTFLQVLAYAFPRDQISATTPERWDDEYYRAALAGKALNLVGELDKRHSIPGGAFKNVVGCDVIEGRHPTHRPFSFICTAAHFFNANRTPPTGDHSDAFFRRWRVILFANSVPPGRERLDLANEIIATEFGEVLGWMLLGAAEVVRNGGIRETKPHLDALARWRVERNSALAFVHDPSACELGMGDDFTTAGKPLFAAYQRWANDAGTQPFGRNGFYEALADGGIRVVKRGNQTFIDGVREAKF